MSRAPQSTTRTDTLFPYTTLFRSSRDLLDQLALGHLIRDFGDHQLPLPAAQPLDSRRAICRVLCFGRVEYAAHAERSTARGIGIGNRSEEHTSELQSLMRI